MYSIDKQDRERKKKFTLNKNNNEYPLDLDPSPLLAKKRAKKEITYKFEQRIFPDDSKQQEVLCEQLLRYGVQCKLFFQRKYRQAKTFMQCYISLAEDAND